LGGYGIRPYGQGFDMGIGKSIESVPVLVAIGIKKTGKNW